MGHTVHCSSGPTVLFWLIPCTKAVVRTTGGQLPSVLMRHPPQLSVKTWGGGGGGGGGGGWGGAVWGGGGRLEGVGGLFGPRGGGSQGGGGLCATHYYHMHTSRGFWGFGGSEVCMQ